MDYLGSQARAAQLFHKDHPFLTGLEQVKMILTLAIVYFAKRTWEIVINKLFGEEMENDQFGSQM